MSFIDWNLSDESPQGQYLSQQSALSGLELQQKRQAQSALQNVNLGDPNSVNSALTGLLKSGMIDQAKGLTDLAMTRGVNSSSLPVIQNALGLAAEKIQAAQQQQSSDQPQSLPQAAPPSDNGSPDYQGAHDALMKEAAADTTDLLNTTDPAARAMKAEALRAKYQQAGIPQANIDEVLGDLSTPGLQKHQQFFQNAANGTPSPHPTNFAASRGQSPDAFDQANATLTGPYADPLVQGIISKYVADVSPGMNQAIAITGPARSEAAHAPYQPVTVEGPQGQNVTVSAQNFAAGQSQPGAQPIVGITPGQHQAQTEQASAPYHPITVKGPQGQDITESAAQFAAGRGAPTEPGQVQGPTNAAPITGPTIAGAAGQQASASAAVQAATDFENFSNGYKVRKANLENLRQAAGDISTGPQAPFWGRIGALAAEYGIKTPFAPTANQAAAYEEVQKMAQSVLAQQKDALGLPNTNQSVSLATGATPHESTSPLGIKRLTGVLEGNEDYINATRQAWETWKARGNGKETYQEFVPQFMKLFDPRVFQAQYLDAGEQAKVRASVKNFDAQEAAARRLGYIGG